MIKIGILVSGRGSNLEAILDAIDKRYITSDEAKVVATNRPNSAALKIAEKHGVPGITVDDQGFSKKSSEYDEKIIAALKSYGVTPKEGLVLLAGYMRIVGDSFIEKYHNRIMNVH